MRAAAATSLLIMFTLSIHIFASSELDQKVEDLQDIFRGSTDYKEYQAQTLALIKKHPNNIKVNRAYLESSIRLNQGDKVAFEYQQRFTKEKNDLNQYLLLKAQYRTLGWSAEEQERKKEIVTKLEKLKDTEGISQYVLIDLIHLSTDPTKKLSFAKKLIVVSADVHEASSQYAYALAKNGMADQLIELCEKHLNAKERDFSVCQQTTNIEAELTEKQQGEIDSIIERMEGLISKSSNVKQLESLYFFFREMRKFKLSNTAAQKILEISPKWMPIHFYIRNGYANSFKEQHQYDQISAANKIANIQERLEKFTDFLEIQIDNNKIQSALYSYFAAAYRNPAAKNLSKEIIYLEKIYTLDPDNTDNIIKLINALIEQKSGYERSLTLLENSFSKLEKLLHGRRGWFNDHEQWVKHSKQYRASLYALKGKLHNILKHRKESYNNYFRAFSVVPKANYAFELGKLKQKEGEDLVALEWFLDSFARLGLEDVTEAEQSKVKATMTTILKRYFYTNFDLELLIEKKTEKILLQDEDDVETENHPLLNQAAIPLKLNDLNGNSFDWKKLKGKNVILSFWATWCSPCIQELPLLNKISKEMKKDNVVVVAVCTDGLKKKRRVSKLIKRAKIDFPVLLAQSTVKEQYKFVGIPALFLIDKNSTIIDIHSGYSPKMEQLIKEKFAL
jgi:thiol-disulfide isomerase/thioredoxin